jgi:hypothetical protein
MGDRTNFVITPKTTAEAKTLADALPGAIVLYSHGGGWDAGPDLAKALRAAKSRIEMGDHGYTSRILVSQIIGMAWSRETGYGLYVGEIGDNEHAVFVVDLEQGKVRLFGHSGTYLSPGSALRQEPTAEWLIADFAALGDEAARAVHMGESDD